MFESQLNMILNLCLSCHSSMIHKQHFLDMVLVQKMFFMFGLAYAFLKIALQKIDSVGKRQGKVFVYFFHGDIYHDLRSLTLGAVNRLATHSALNEWLRAVKPFKKFIPSTVMDRYRDNASQLWPWIGFLVKEKEEEFSFARVTSVARGRWKAVRRHLPLQTFIYNRMCYSSLETRILTTLAGHGRRQSSPQIQE